MRDERCGMRQRPEQKPRRVDLGGGRKLPARFLAGGGTLHQVAVKDVGLARLSEDLGEGSGEKLVAGVQEKEIVAPGMGSTLVHGVVDARVRFGDMPPEMGVLLVGGDCIEAAVG